MHENDFRTYISDAFEYGKYDHVEFLSRNRCHTVIK